MLYRWYALILMGVEIAVGDVFLESDYEHTIEIHSDYKVLSSTFTTLHTYYFQNTQTLNAMDST